MSPRPFSQWPHLAAASHVSHPHGYVSALAEPQTKHMTIWYAEPALFPLQWGPILIYTSNTTNGKLEEEDQRTHEASTGICRRNRAVDET